MLYGNGDIIVEIFTSKRCGEDKVLLNVKCFFLLLFFCFLKEIPFFSVETGGNSVCHKDLLDFFLRETFFCKFYAIK